METTMINQVRPISFENLDLAPAALAALKAGALSAAVVLVCQCDASGVSPVQACREAVRTMDVARAKSRVNQLKSGAARGLNGEQVYLAARTGPRADESLVARASEELKLAQEDVDARLRACESAAAAP
jgi:hypothetical protein